MGAEVWLHQTGRTELECELVGLVCILHDDVHLRHVRWVVVCALVQHNKGVADQQSGVLDAVVAVSVFFDQCCAKCCGQKINQ